MPPRGPEESNAHTGTDGHVRVSHDRGTRTPDGERRRDANRRRSSSRRRDDKYRDATAGRASQSPLSRRLRARDMVGDGIGELGARAIALASDRAAFILLASS